MGLLLGLAAAVMYGSTDFAGGLLSRRTSSPLAVIITGSTASGILTWAALALTGGSPPGPHVIAWSLLAGACSGIGTVALYRGLARGRMSVVGPVSAVGAAVLPVIMGMATGERPSPLAILGVLLALPAIALVAGDGDGDASTAARTGTGTRTATGTEPADGRPSRSARLRSSGLTDGLIAGVAFGVFFIALAQAGGGAGLWPMAFEQIGALSLVLAAAAATHTPLRLPPRDAAASASIGIGGLIATFLYYAATHAGMLAIVAVLTSLYPGVTVLLARTVVRERISRSQRAGLSLCALAIVAIAA